MTRPTWDETWLAVADVIALRSRCALTKVGAVIVGHDQRVVATGHNGQPQGLQVAGPCDEWCPRARDKTRQSGYANCLAVHAELNAIAYADRRHMEGGTLYVTCACCWDCSKVVANSGIARLVMRVSQDDIHREPYKSIKFLDSCGVSVRVV